jgi:UDP-N-acetylmuramoylalanine--D-glutamate ligase
MNELTGKKVLIVGLGRSGIAAARHCAAAGASVTVADAKPADELAGALAALAGLPVRQALGGHDPALPAAHDLVVASPGVPLDAPGFAEARARGVPIVGELELAVRRISRPIVAVTGTNGKTTTTSLIGHLLAAARLRACVAGNIGTPLLDALAEADAADAVVLEVSSFQIDTTPSLAPEVGVWLNVTQDHLDRHGTFENYVASKARLFEQMSEAGYGIYNAADGAVAKAMGSARCRRLPFDATTARAPSSDEGGAWSSGGELVVQLPGREAHRYALGRVQLSGVHNRENMLAALLAAELCGAEPALLAEGLATFRGLPHRVELVAEAGGVRYFDDSKGTNVGATIRALEGFAEPVVLIAGGLGKGADFAPLAPAVRGKVKRLVLIGEAAGAIERALAGAAPAVRAASMEEAVAKAAEAAAPGEVVLLSPACASFDMFRDYAHRGECFAAAVRKLATEKRGAQTSCSLRD